MKLKILVVSCCLMFLVFASQVMGSMTGNIVRNGDFEFGDLSFWSNVSPSGNLIKNGDFEDGLNNWVLTSGDAATVSNVAAYSGSFGFESPDGSTEYRQTVKKIVLRGEYLHVSWYFKPTDPTDYWLSLDILIGMDWYGLQAYRSPTWQEGVHIGFGKGFVLTENREVGNGWWLMEGNAIFSKDTTLELVILRVGSRCVVYVDNIYLGTDNGIEGSVTAKSKYSGNYGFESPIGAECGYVQTVNTQIEANSINYLNAKYKPLSSTFNLRFLLLIGTSSYTVAASESGVTVPSGWTLIENNDVGNGWYSLKVKLTFAENKVIQSLSFMVGSQQMYLDNIEIYVSSGIPVEMGDTPTIQPSVDTSDFPVMLGLGAFGLLMFAIIPVLTIKNLKKGNYTFLAWSFVFLIIGYGAIIAWLVG